MKLLRSLRALVRGEKLDAEMSEEIRAHLELQSAANERAGMTPANARDAARRAFGGVEQIKEHARAQRSWRWLDDLRRDFRFALRVVAKAPVVSAVIVLSLAIGLGANTAVFSWIHTVAFNPLPGVRDGTRLTIIEQHTASGIVQFASPAEWRDVQAQTKAFSDVFAQNITTFNFERSTGEVRVWGENVSANFFDALGVQPVLGRALRADDDDPGRPPVVVISHRLWLAKFGGRPDAIGQPLRLNGLSFTVVGVAPAAFHGGVTALAFDVWIPQATTWPRDDRRLRHFRLMGRLRPGIDLHQANADTTMIFARLAETYPATNRGVSAEVIPTWRSRIGAESVLVPTLATLQTVTILLLLVVCTNTANLLLAQGTTRSKEIAIRLSLGAGRTRVVRQLLTEGLLLALAGVGLGVGLAIFGLDQINRIPMPTTMPVVLTAHIDWAELWFSLGLALACTLAFGLAPALQLTRTNVGAALKLGGQGSSVGGRRRFQNILVGAEIALTLVIVIMAGLFVKSFKHARELNPGFESRDVLLCSFDLKPANYNPAKARAFLPTLLAQVREVPGIDSAAVATWVPLDLVFTLPTEFTLEGRRNDPNAPDQTLWYETSRGYFDTLHIGFIEGRDFEGGVQNSPAPEAIVNDEFVRRYLAPGQSPLGRTINARSSSYRIVGVVRGGKYNSLTEAPQPLVYFSFSGLWRTRLTLFVRTPRDPVAMAAAIATAVHRLDPELTLLETRTLNQHLDNAMILQVIPAKLLAIIGPLALFLALTGLYSILAYAVVQRTHEIGVRMALGASARAVVMLILRQGLAAVGVGLIGGLGVAYWISGRLTRQLVQVSPGDPELFAILPLVIAAVALLAAWLPARRAAKVDPMVALRAE
jgi:macrolide transport system ATP-binding/permease protein